MGSKIVKFWHTSKPFGDDGVLVYTEKPDKENPIELWVQAGTAQSLYRSLKEAVKFMPEGAERDRAVLVLSFARGEHE